MGDNSLIEWTDATWNPATGCDKVSPGCKNCYAERLSLRLQKMGNPKYQNGFVFTLHPEALHLPETWKQRKKIFVNSMSDLFHERMDEQYLDAIFQVMIEADWHIFQVLTKRPERMRDYLRDRTISVTKHFKNGMAHTTFRDGFPENIWLGTSIEMDLYKSRIQPLKETKAKIKFLSCEPLLGPLGKLDLSEISWVITGGESGPGHREMKAEWVREIRDQCIEQRVPFFFKQWGGARPGGEALLDGREWKEYPKP